MDELDATASVVVSGPADDPLPESERIVGRLVIRPDGPGGVEDLLVNDATDGRRGVGGRDALRSRACQPSAICAESGRKW
jgi:hypothetical protein